MFSGSAIKISDGDGFWLADSDYFFLGVVLPLLFLVCTTILILDSMSPTRVLRLCLAAIGAILLSVFIALRVP